MEKNHGTRLTSAEMAGLWGQYVKDTGKVCLLKYFKAIIEDRDFLPVIETDLHFTEEHLRFLAELFKTENFPLPTGFTQNDVHISAPRLFSDLYCIQYLKDMSIVQMTTDTLAIGLGSRFDIIEFHEKLLKEAIQTQDMIKEVLLQKGIYIRPPYIPIPDQVDFVTNQNFLGKLIGKQRPLSVIEISHLFLTTETNIIGKETMLAFAQVAKSQEVQHFLLRGKDIANKHIKILSKLLIESDLPASVLWDAAVTNSKVSPFSDKLMMFLVTAMSGAGISKYGAAMGASPRKDIGLKYGRFLTEMSLFVEDGANIMIDNGWFEEPPHCPSHG